MRYLLLCHSFPSLMSPIARWLAGQPESETLVAAAWIRGSQELPGLKKILLKKPKNLPEPENYMDYWANAVKIGRHALFSLQSIQASGFKPDIIFACTASGAALALPEAFPDSFLVNYLDQPAGLDPAESAMRARLQSLQIAGSHMNFSFSQAAAESQPPALRKLIKKAPVGVDLDFFQYRAFGDRQDIALFSFPEGGEMSQWLDYLQNIQDKRPECKFVIIAYSLKNRNSLQAGLERLPTKARGAMMVEYNPHPDLARRLYGAAKLLISPEIEVRGQMLEAMACGVPVMCAADKFLKDGKNCVKFSHSASKVADILRDEKALARMGLQGAKDVAKKLDAAGLTARHMRSILAEAGKDL